MAKKIKTFLIPPDLIQMIQETAVKKGISQNVLLEQILRNWIESQTK